MFPTPSTDHVCFDRVYEPAEDSYLVLDTLSSPSEIAFLQERFATSTRAPPLVLEVGVGSGVVLAFVAANASKIFGRKDVLALGSDINGFACRSASQTMAEAVKADQSCESICLGTINSDLASALRDHSIDILIFNPPYVPAALPDFSRHSSINALATENRTPVFDQDSYLLELSYAGGEDGMIVTNRLLDQIPQVLDAERGCAYVLLCAQNKPGQVKARIGSWGNGWRAETVGSSGKQAGWEKLQILRIWKDFR